MPRVIFLAAAGATAVALAYGIAPESNDEVVTAVRPARTPSKPPPARTAVPSSQAVVATRPAIAPAGAADPFIASSFVPPPPPAPVVIPPPPPPPKAPPLPFTFVGLLESGAGKPAAFLAHGETLLVVSAGETVESDYRIESLSPTEIVVVYLPLQERQRLSVSGAKP